MEELEMDWEVLSDNPPSDEEILNRIAKISGACMFRDSIKSYVIDIYRESCGTAAPYRYWLFDERGRTF